MINIKEIAVPCLIYGTTNRKMTYMAAAAISRALSIRLYDGYGLSGDKDHTTRGVAVLLSRSAIEHGIVKACDAREIDINTWACFALCDDSLEKYIATAPSWYARYAFEEIAGVKRDVKRTVSFGDMPGRVFSEQEGFEIYRTTARDRSASANASREREVWRRMIDVETEECDPRLIVRVGKTLHVKIEE